MAVAGAVAHALIPPAFHTSTAASNTNTDRLKQKQATREELRKEHEIGLVATNR